MNDLTWSGPNGAQIPDSDKAVAAAARDEEQTMNMITPENFAKLRQETEENPTLAKLMKAWEDKLGKNAKRAAGFGLVAVSLAACGGSGSGSGENGENGENGTTPIPEGGRFFVLDFPTRTVNTQEIGINGGTIPIEDALEAFADLVDVELAGGGEITIENINIVQEAADQAENVVLIQADGLGAISFADFVGLLQANNVITVGRVILTPEVNSGVVIVPGMAPGDQFVEGEFGTMGNPSDGDDTIFMGRTELLHAAILDGGAGNDTLVIEAKGPYAQPSAVWNIETIRILNSENTTADVLARVDDQKILTPAQIGDLILSTFPLARIDPNDQNTWIDLSAAFDIETLIIGENVGVTDSNLAVIGVNNGAELVLQGGFANNVLISSGFNFGTSGIFRMSLEDVNFEAGAQLSVAQNSTHLAINSTGDEPSVENFIANGDFGGNLRQMTITGDKFLHVGSDLNFNAGRTSTIDASANTGGVKLSMRGDIGDGEDGVAQGVNVQIIQDLSGSMGGQRILDAIQAATDTVNAFDAAGEARFQIVEFDSTATRTEWLSAADAIARINGWTAGGGTNFTAGIAEAIEGINDPGALPGAAFVTFPIGDGDVDVDANSTPSVADWEAFLTANNGVSYPIGIGTGVDLAALDGLGFNGITGQPIAAVDDSTIDLVTLVNELVGEIIGGIGGLLQPTQQDIMFTGSQGDDDVTFYAENSVTVSGGEGDNLYTLAAREITVTGADGNDTVVMRGFDENAASGRADGALVNVDLGGGDGTVVLGLMGFGVTAREGSSIAGESVTIVVRNTSDLRNAELTGVDSVKLDATLTLTSSQLGALGAAAFSTVDGTIGGIETLHILVEGDVVLSDLIDTSAMDSLVKLTFFIPEGASLTLSAQELHELLAQDAIEMGDGSNGTSPGKLTVTDAGLNFDPFSGAFVGPDELPIVGGGTIDGADNNVTVERSPDGWDRPSQALLDDEVVIDSSGGPVEIGPNAFGEADEYTIPQTTTLTMVGENDITFTAPVSFDGQRNFTIDFSEVGGSVTGLEIVDFHNVTWGTPANWGSIAGNGDVRIDVQLDGNVGTSANGLISSGVATYVVTDLNGMPRQFWTSEPTEDLEVLGLQGNYFDGGITFGNVVAGVSFLMEVAEDKFDGYAVGLLNAIFARDNVDAVVNVVGLQELPSGEVQTVEGINLINAATATINVEGGNTVIEILAGGFTEVTFTADADLEIETDLLPDLTVIDASGVAGIFTATISSPAEEFTFTGGEGGAVLTLDGTAVDANDDPIPLDGENTIDGGAGGAELVIDGVVDLSDSTLINITSVSLEDGANLTMTADQVIEIGGFGNFTVADGDNATLTLSVTEDFDVDALDLDSLPEGLALDLSIQSEVEFNVTGDQLVALFEAGVTISDGSGADAPGTVNVSDLNQTHLPFDPTDPTAINDYASIMDAATLAELAGTVTLEAGAEVYVSTNYGPWPGEFSWELEGGTLGIARADVADGLAVNNGDVQFYFIFLPTTTIDAAAYTNIGTLFINENGLPPTFNVESITSLDSDTTVEIVPLAPLEFGGADRFVIVGGVPFATNEFGDPFNPATGDAGPVTSGVNLVFNNVSGDPNFNVETVTILFDVGGNIVGNIVIGAGEAGGNAFEKLTLFSSGDEVNTIGNISAAGNNLVDTDGEPAIEIVADQALVAGTITLTSGDADLDAATVVITGAADVEVKGIVAGAGVTTLTVDTSGHSGTYTVTGGSPSVTGPETLVFVGGEDSTVLLDWQDGEDGQGDAAILGVDGSGDLETIDASGMAGRLALGDVANVANGFELIGGTGVITGNMVNVPAMRYSLDISDAADGSAIDFPFGGADVSLTSGSFAFRQFMSGDTNVIFGDDTTLVVNGVVDFRGFTNLVFGENVELVLGEDGLVLMDDDQFAAFEAAGGEITGETSFVFDNDNAAPFLDAGVFDLSDIRGLEEISLVTDGPDALANPVKLTLAQLDVATPIDEDGEPTADAPGDINALKAAPGLIVRTVEGDEFELTDVEADGLSITGDGAVEVTVVGTQGANLAFTAGENNVAGQSVTVNYTLGGVAGSVTLTNSIIDFRDAAAVEAAVMDLLEAEDGLAVDGSNVSSEEPGVPFEVTGVDVVAQGGDPVEVEVSPVVVSTADFSSNEVDDTTHVFPPLATGFYVFSGVLPGGSDPTEDYTVVLSGENFVDASGMDPAEVPGNVVGIALDGGMTLKLTGALADGLEVGGDGVLRLEMPGGADLSGVSVPTEIETSGVPTVFTGTFPSVAVSILGNPNFEDGDTPWVFDMTGAANAPGSLGLVDAQVLMSVEEADGLSVTGTDASSATVSMGINNNALLGGIDVDLTLDGAGVEFGGQLPSGVGITVSGNVTFVNSAVIPAGTVLTLAANANVDLTGAVIGDGVSIRMEANAALAITGAQADGMSIVTIDADGDPDDNVPATVTLSDVQAGQDLSGIAIGTLVVAFDDADAAEFTLPASAVAGNTVTVQNDGGGINLLTITGVDGANADFSGLTVTAGEVDDEGVVSPGEANVTFEVNAAGGFTFGEDTDFGVAAAGDVTVAITGAGTVTVDEDADMTGVNAYTVGTGSILVTDASRTGEDDFVNPALVSGGGRLQYTELEAAPMATVAANDEVRTNEFVFDSEDTGVTINGFEAIGALDGRFIFDDDPELEDPIIGTMRLDLRDFDTTGSAFEATVVADRGDLDFDEDGVIVITDGAAGDVLGANFGALGADNAVDAQAFFVVAGATGADVWYWDDAGGNSDGIVDAGELDLVATLTSVDLEDLGSENFLI